MSVSFNIAEFMEAEVPSVNTRPEKNGPEEKRSAMDINYTINVPASFLNKLSLGDKIDYESVFFDKDGQVKNTGVKSISFEREFESHRMGISFSSVDTKKAAQYFPVERICKFNAKLEHGKRVKLNFQCQLHPSVEKDIGWLVKGCYEKQVHITFEPMQGDIEDGEEKSGGGGKKAA